MILKTIAQRQFLITFLQIIGVAAAYFITGKLGDLLAIPPSYATVIFPSSGIALASILLYGNRMAGGVLLGAFLLNASIPVTPNYFLENLNSALLITLAISSGATLQAVVAAYLVRRFASTPNILSNQKNILLFLFYGGFVSALVNSTFSVSLLVATGQMSAEAFLLNWLSWWGGDALGIIIFTPLVLVCLSTENPVWQGRRKAITLPILTMFLLTVMAIFYEIETSNSRIKMEFDQRTKELSSLMETAIISNLNALRFLNDFYITSKFVDENQFQTFAAFPLKIFPSMLNLGFAPVIKAAEREKFENSLKRNGVSNFQITEQDAETKKLVRAGNRPEYTPISFIESNKLSDNIRNLDLYFMPSRRDAMDKARDTGELFVTTNVTLVYEMGKYNGVVAFIPVYQTGLPHGTIAERRAAILGYNFAAFRNVEMVKFALKNQNLAGLSYRLIDNNAPVEKELLFASDEQETAPEALRNTNMLMRHTTFNLVGGRVWRFELTPTADYFLEHRSANVWSILWLGLTLTIITIITVLLSAIRQFELVISNAELAFQNSEKEKRAAELIEFHLKNDQLKSQLNHMQKLESIGRLTSGIAHDFNNILACMLGYNEINKMDSEDITDESLRASVENNTKQIDLAGKRAVELINKMLIYCRQDKPKKKIDVQSTTEVIHEVLAMLRPALTSRIQIETVLESDAIIQMDTIDLHQILTNLAINARDSMREMGGVIAISLKKVRTTNGNCAACAAVLDGEFIELSVSDNGTGIEPKIIHRLFDPFFTTKPQGEGTGLGLSAVSGLVHQSGGHILVESNQSEFNHGTAFKLLFPISIDATK